jgi:hypothetical protein
MVFQLNKFSIAVCGLQKFRFKFPRNLHISLYSMMGFPSNKRFPNSCATQRDRREKSFLGFNRKNQLFVGSCWCRYGFATGVRKRSFQNDGIPIYNGDSRNYVSIVIYSKRVFHWFSGKQCNLNFSVHRLTQLFSLEM